MSMHYIHDRAVNGKREALGGKMTTNYTVRYVFIFLGGAKKNRFSSRLESPPFPFHPLETALGDEWGFVSYLGRVKRKIFSRARWKNNFHLFPVAQRGPRLDVNSSWSWKLPILQRECFRPLNSERGNGEYGFIWVRDMCYLMRIEAAGVRWISLARKTATSDRC